MIPSITLLSVAKIAETFKVSKATVYRRIKDACLFPVSKEKNSNLYDESDVFRVFAPSEEPLEKELTPEVPIAPKVTHQIAKVTPLPLATLEPKSNVPPVLIVVTDIPASKFTAPVNEQNLELTDAVLATRIAALFEFRHPLHKEAKRIVVTEPEVRSINCKTKFLTNLEKTIYENCDTTYIKVIIISQVYQDYELDRSLTIAEEAGVRIEIDFFLSLRSQRASLGVALVQESNKLFKLHSGICLSEMTWKFAYGFRHAPLFVNLLNDALNQKPKTLDRDFVAEFGIYLKRFENPLNETVWQTVTALLQLSNLHLVSFFDRYLRSAG